VVVITNLHVDGSKLILRFVEFSQDVFWGHVGGEGKGAGVEPDVDKTKLVY